jgi:predicted transcriptional regulator
MFKAVVTVLFMLSMSTFFAQQDVEDLKKMIDRSAESQKELIDATSPMMKFLLKYDNGKSKPTQSDFDQMLNQMGIMDEVQNDNSGLTKEDAFKFVDAYIRADQGEKIDIGQDKKDKVLEYLNQIEQGKKEAEQIFNQVITQDKVNQMINEATKELKAMQAAGFGISYDDFKKEALKKKPEATDAEIQKAYKDLMKQLGL